VLLVSLLTVEVVSYRVAAGHSSRLFWTVCCCGITAKSTVVDLSRDVFAETDVHRDLQFLGLFGTYDLNFVVVISLVAGYPYQRCSNWYILVTSLDCGLHDNAWPFDPCFRFRP
jgi:hypothetical protein